MPSGVFLFLLAVGALVGLLLLPTISDAASLFRLFSKTRLPQPGPRFFPRLLFLIPAHNEELLIEGCVASLFAQRYPKQLYTALVIADNCSDATAVLARAAGANCLERHDERRRGKPWAIAWALKQVNTAEFDAMVIVDADSILDPEFASELARVADLRSRAIQSFNGVRNAGESALARMAAILSTAYYCFAYPLKARAGLNVPLTGAGMCVGTGVLERYGWNAFSRSEDVELYVRLTLEGVRIDPAPGARVYSQEARSLQQVATQRQRWRGGRLEIAHQLGWVVVRSPRLGIHQKLDILAELTAPGPVVHLTSGAILGVLILLVHPPGSAWLLTALTLTFIRPVVLTTLAIRRHGSCARSLRAFLFLPVYALWRLGTEILTLIRLRNRKWTRTQRHGRSDAES